MDARAIGEKIAKLRKDKEMTQKQLAEQLNLTDQAVSKWENGGAYPDITVLPTLADLLGVTITSYLAAIIGISRTPILILTMTPICSAIVNSVIGRQNGDVQTNRSLQYCGVWPQTTGWLLM